ncbi:hypothetical protein [Clostridium sp. Marseille-Q7071]
MTLHSKLRSVLLENKDDCDWNLNSKIVNGKDLEAKNIRRRLAEIVKEY